MNKDIKILLFAFLFAFALWFYINLNQSYSLDFSIPLDVQTSKTKALSEEIPNSIEVTLKGKGWDLMNILISKDLRYNLDISKINKDSKILTEQFVNERLNLNPNVSVLKISPDTININFDKLSEKIVPIKSNIVVNLKEGYSIVGKPVLIPDSIRIQGASYLLNKIKFIPTELKVFNNVNDNLRGIINIKDTLPNLIKIDPRLVNYEYSVQLSAEKNLDDVNVNILNVPDDKEVLLIPPKVSVSLRGGVDQLSLISQSDIDVNVEYENIENDTLGFVIPEVKIPNQTSLLKLEPQKLQYIIKKKL